MPQRAPTHRPPRLTLPEQRPTACQRGYDRRWQAIRAAILADHPLCAECSALATDVDHIVPRRQGGSDHESNLQALCHACHGRKTAKERRQ